FDHDPALPVQDTERVGELENVAESFDVTVTAPALEIADVRRAVHGAEIDDVIADVQVTGGVAGVQHEALRGERKLRLDQIAPEAHDLRRVIDQPSGAPIHTARRGAADLESRLLEHAERSLEDALDLLGAEDFEWRKAVREARQWSERGPARARRPAPFAPAG